MIIDQNGTGIYREGIALQRHGSRNKQDHQLWGLLPAHLRALCIRHERGLPEEVTYGNESTEFQQNKERKNLPSRNEMYPPNKRMYSKCSEFHLPEWHKWKEVICPEFMNRQQEFRNATIEALPCSRYLRLHKHSKSSLVSRPSREKGQWRIPASNRNVHYTYCKNEMPRQNSGVLSKRSVAFVLSNRMAPRESPTFQGPGECRIESPEFQPANMHLQKERIAESSTNHMNV